MKLISWVKKLVLYAALLGIAEPAAAQEKPVNVPLKGIVLFTSGVGYFRHEGTVDGNARMDLEFSAAGVNDILKSLILRDMDGGAVSSVTYSSRDPVTRTLKSFAVDLTGNPTVAAILAQLRGKTVEASAPDPVRGTILGVEEQVRTSDKSETVVPILNLLTAQGIKSLPLSQVQGIQFTDKDLQADFNAALALIASSKDLDKKKVALHFSGSGKRRVSVGYIQEAPVWKTSYRLAVGEDKNPFLQGWAVVENVTDRDWNDVGLTLVSGRPITFIMDLYTPLYAERPEVPLDLGVSLLPRTYDMEVATGEDKLENELDEEASGAVKEMAAAPKSKMAPAPAPSRSAPRGEPMLDLSKGVSAAARASEVGELFQYAIKDSVTLPRQQSALFPIVNQAIGGEKFSIYNESVDPAHPLNALRLENKSGLHLMKGPMTVFDGGSYAGDALLSDFPAGAKQFVSYAVDLDTEVAPQAGPAPQDLFGVKFSKGIVTTTYKQSRQRDFKVTNRGSKAKSVIIEAPIDGQWSLVQPKEPMERSRSDYRFLLGVEAGKTKNLAVIEERLMYQSVSANNLANDTIGFYIRSTVVSPAVKDALQKLLALKQKSADARAGRERIEAQIQDIHKDQERIRENLERLESGSNLYNRYVKTLNDQEDKLAALSDGLEKAKSDEAARQKDVDAFILTVDVK